MIRRDLLLTDTGLRELTIILGVVRCASPSREVPEAEVGNLLDQIRATGWRPPQIDGRLLATSRSALGGSDLDSVQRAEVRDVFLDALEVRVRPDEALAGEPDPPARIP